MLLKIYNFFYLAFCLIITRVIFRDARIIRYPFHFRLCKPVKLNGFTCGVGNRIDFFSGDLRIGNNVQINDYNHIACVEKIYIGDNVLIASKVYISDHDHVFGSPNIPVVKNKLNSKPVQIGDNTWIGENVCILKGVTLGDNCVVGAGSVVTKSFPRGSVILGNPAKSVRNTFSNDSAK